MSRVQVVAGGLAALMVAAILAGFANGAFAAEGRELLSLAWGRVTLVDLYLAFGAVWAWIAWREAHVGRAALWAVLVATTGSVAIWGYVALAAARADSFPSLLLGPHRS